MKFMAILLAQWFQNRKVFTVQCPGKVRGEIVHVYDCEAPLANDAAENLL